MSRSTFLQSLRDDYFFYSIIRALKCTAIIKRHYVPWMPFSSLKLAPMGRYPHPQESLGHPELLRRYKLLFIFENSLIPLPNLFHFSSITTLLRTGGSLGLLFSPEALGPTSTDDIFSTTSNPSTTFPNWV